jgi:hypothetical protein
VVRVRWDGASLQLQPLQGSARSLVPVGGAFFRAPERREATHVLLRTEDGHPVISDGFRTLERVRSRTVYARWASAVAGLLGLLYLLFVGGVRSARSLVRGTWRSEPLGWPASCLLLMLLAPALYLLQPYLAIGDATPANLTVAVLTGALPFTLVVAAVHRVRAGLQTGMARLDLLALAAGLQWCAMLAAREMIPLTLWR